MSKWCELCGRTLHDCEACGVSAVERAVLEAAKRYARSLQGPRTNESHVEWDEAITELCETARKLGEEK